MYKKTLEVHKIILDRKIKSRVIKKKYGIDMGIDMGSDSIREILCIGVIQRTQILYRKSNSWVKQDLFSVCPGVRQRKSSTK